MNFLVNYFQLDWWVVFGLLGQAAFFGRFVVQWIYSEKHKKSLIPVHFWYLSILGASIIFVYAIHRRDPVFFLGQLFAILIYIRNLHLIKKENKTNNEQ